MKVKAKWVDDRKIKGWLDTIYETDNGLELDEMNYQEFFVHLVKVQSILQKPLMHNEQFAVGTFIEISARDNVVKISLEEGAVVWEK